MKRINYPSCDKQGHQSEPLSRICVEKDCQNKTVICCICEQLNHKGHKTSPIKNLLQKINPNGFADGFNPLYYSNKIQDIKVGYFNTISNEKNKILNYFNDLQTQGQIFFNKIQQTTLSLINIGNPLNFLNQINSNPKVLRSYFNQLMKFVNYQDKQVFSLKKQLQNIVDTCTDKLKKIKTTLDQIIVQFDKNIQKILFSFDQIAVSKPQVFQWSQTLKGHKVKITDTIAQQTNMQSSGQRFALIQPGLSQFGKKKLLWGIKIKKFVGWVGVGICLKNSIKNANYHFNYTNTGHGSYLISSNGYSWSHSVKQFNSAFKTFQFAVNDIVYMQYDPQTWTLRFRKNQGLQKFELSIVPPPSDDSYHPCVNLCSTGDSVQIIIPGLPIS